MFWYIGIYHNIQNYNTRTVDFIYTDQLSIQDL